MDAIRFDALARSLAATSRRSLLGVALGSAVALRSRRMGARQATPDIAATPLPAETTSPQASSICVNPDTAGLQERTPGDLVAFEEITDLGDPDFPAGSRAWRVLYVSTGKDNTERTLVCGVVMAPDSLAGIHAQLAGDGSTGRVVAWAHGTLGLVERCQPSTQPALEIWGAPPFGINTVAWGNDANNDKHVGKVEDGILAGMFEAGWIVTATDYYADLWGGETLEPFVIGKIEAANTIDSVRAAHHLLKSVHDEYALNGYDVITWGHSQGGHAAMWAGQLLSSYAAATTAPGGPALALSGVALEAPATGLIKRLDREPAESAGFSLFDWTSHAQLQLTGQPQAIPLAPFFFSYVFATWAQYADNGVPLPSEMPAYPDLGSLDVTALVRPEAMPAIEQMKALCWGDGEQVVEVTRPYATKPFLVPAVADGQMVDGLQHGNFDTLCANDPPAEIAKWCAWLSYNLPGPLGTSLLDTLPKRGDQLVPVLIATGNNDGVVHCVAPKGMEDAIPPANNCPAVAFYELLTSNYCPDGGNHGHLALKVWRGEPGVTVADHSDVTGLVAAASSSELTFVGSPLHEFFVGAFEGTLEAGCSAELMN